jgi:hypothetical protein
VVFGLVPGAVERVGRGGLAMVCRRQAVIGLRRWAGAELCRHPSAGRACGGVWVGCRFSVEGVADDIEVCREGRPRRHEPTIRCGLIQTALA